MKKIISLIVSVYNEEEAISEFYQITKEIITRYVSNPDAFHPSSVSGQENSGRLAAGDFSDKVSEKSPSLDYEFCFVDDGSTDKSPDILSRLKLNDPAHIAIITLSRNFGHEAAMTAGLDYAKGDYLIFMDADLQHPPAFIPKIMEKFTDGAQVINMVRTKNESSGFIKKITSGTFYALINSVSFVTLTPGASDFFALDKKTAQVLRRNYREKVRFLRGYVQNIGFNRAVIEYEAEERVAGKSHYGLKKLFNLSIDALVCFSDVPLKFGIYAGLISGALGLILIIYTLLTRQGAPSGYATIIIVLCFMFAVLFFLLGIIGMYLAVIFRETQDRPIYIIKDIKGPGL